MITEVTQGVKVSVHTQYEEAFSEPEKNHFLFSYRITIQNQNPFPIKLLRRHWEIKDSLSPLREVDGEGVVGEQPVIGPGEIYSYESASNLTSEIGSMSGNYLFKRLPSGETFKVSIPEFPLETPARLN